MACRTQEHALFTFTTLLWRIQLRNSQVEEMHIGGGWWPGGAVRTQSFYALSRHASLPALQCCSKPRSSLNLMQEFLQSSISLTFPPPLTLLFLPRVGGWGSEFQLYLVFLEPVPSKPSGGPALSHQININSGVIKGAC